MNRRFKYQFGGKPKKQKEKKGSQYYKDRNEKIRNRIVAGLDKVTEGFGTAIDRNVEGPIDAMVEKAWEGVDDRDLPKAALNFAGATAATIPGFMLPATGAIGTHTLSEIVKNLKSNPDWKEDMKKNAAKFKMPGAMYKKGGEKKASSYSVKNKKRKKVEKWSTGDVESKRVTRKKRRSTTVKERNDMLSDLQYNAPGDLNPTKVKREAMEYGDKKVTKRRFKSKTSSKSGKETKRREKIVYDDGNQMKKRKQRKIRFGKNKGKIKSKTIHYNRGKRTKTVEYRDATDKTKLQTGGFLEAPTIRLFED